jgi:hypothetical protein
MIEEYEIHVPMVRVALPEKLKHGKDTIKTAIGDVELRRDHKVHSVADCAEMYAKELGYRPARVELVTPARKYGLRFAINAFYLGYREAGDAAPSFYILEWGLVTGQARVLQLGKTMDGVVDQLNDYKPTPFTERDHPYRTTLRVENNEPIELHVNASAPGRSSYMAVKAKYERVESMPPQHLLVEFVQTVARVFAIAKVMHFKFLLVPNAVEKALAYLGMNYIPWIAKPKLLPHDSKPLTKAFRIITFDGGGILGVIGARLLQRLFKERPELLANDVIDFYAGTSIGSISASMLALGSDPNALMKLMRGGIRSAFLPFPHVPWKKRGKRVPLYFDPAQVLAMEIPDSFLPLSKVRPRILLPTFDLGSRDRAWRPVFQSNLPGSTTADISVIDATLRSAACPIYWPSQNGFVDGWIVANNPCMAAVVATLDRRQLGRSLAELRVLSFGVGVPSVAVSRGSIHWGQNQWLGGDHEDATMVAGPLLDMLLSNASRVPALQAEQLLGPEQFLRLDVALPRPVPMDATDQIQDLIDLVDQVALEPYLDWLDAHWA